MSLEWPTLYSPGDRLRNPVFRAIPDVAFQQNQVVKSKKFSSAFLVSVPPVEAKVLFLISAGKRVIIANGG
jgi:hypothetical protein